jgi:HlyD family secretion protein/macrolide-specific efflux system membrane fusion protein
VSAAQSDAPPAQKRRRRRRWPWLLGALVLAAASGGAALAARRPNEPIDPALIVTATRSELAVEVVDVGRIEAKRQVEIESKVPGRVAEVLVREGDRVAAGAPLIRLDTRDFARQVAREKSSLDRARAALAFSELDRERKLRGAEQGVASRVDADLARHTARLAGIDVAASRVALATARDRLRDARIAAPIAGTVLRRAIEPGEMVTPGIESTFEKRSLLTLADLSELVVRVELNQIDVAKVRLGQRVTLEVDAIPGERFRATISEIAPASIKPPGKELDVFPVEALLEKSDPRIKPGMTADVRIHVSARPRVIALPIEAVRREGERSFVTRVVAGERGDAKERTEVQVGARNDRLVEIVSGLGEGERVLVDPPSAEANETKI